MNRNAAGIDVGSAEHSGAVPPDRSPEPVRRFASCTADLQAVADGRQACRLETVVRDSTGGYGIPLVQLLDARGVEGHLVKARHAKHLPGRKTDIADGQWLQTLHPCGRLNRSFRPTDDLWVLRSSLRPRDPLLSAAATGIQPRQQALTAMNVQLANVLRATSGVTGMAMIRALLDGERDPVKLAAVQDYRLNASTAMMAQSLAGNGRDEWRFHRRQAQERYEGDQQKMAECDLPMEAHLPTVDRKIELPDHPRPTPTRRPKTARRHEPTCALHPQLYRLSGVDWTLSDGLEVLTAQPLIAAIGLDMRRWKTEPHFVSWRG